MNKINLIKLNKNNKKAHLKSIEECAIILHINFAK